MQVSKQFVPLVCGRIVAIMDQHAAAERVRLEQLQQEVTFLPDALYSLAAVVMLPAA